MLHLGMSIASIDLRPGLCILTALVGDQSTQECRPVQLRYQDQANYDLLA